MSDLIDRQDAIDAVHKAGITEYDETLAIEEIERVPYAQREGKWIKEHEEWFTDYPYKCTNCGKYSRARYRFCPNCGADMRGECNEQ